MVLLIFTDRLLFIGACVFVILIWNGKKKKNHGILLRPDICLIVQPSELESERDLQCFGWCYKSRNLYFRMKCRATVCKELQLITGKRKKALCVNEREEGCLSAYEYVKQLCMYLFPFTGPVDWGSDSEEKWRGHLTLLLRPEFPHNQWAKHTYIHLSSCLAF